MDLFIVFQVRRRQGGSKRNPEIAVSVHILLLEPMLVFYVLSLFFRNSDRYNAFVISNTESQTEIMW